MNLVGMLTIGSAAAFIGYGLLCLLSDHMKKEFERFGLSQFRRLVGLLEFAGGLGLILGFYYPPMHFISSGGLSLLMILGIYARWKVRDSLVLQLPAFILLVVNIWLFNEHLS